MAEFKNQRSKCHRWILPKPHIFVDTNSILKAKKVFYKPFFWRKTATNAFAWP